MKTYLSILLILQAASAILAFAEFGPIHHHTILNSQGIPVDPKIMGGSLAGVGQIPFQVAVYGSNNPNSPEEFCGGVLISNTAVLTAAHCISTMSYFDVVLGTLRPLDESSAGRVQIKTTQKYVHEAYNFTAGLNNDIGILILPEPITVSQTIKPILLPKRKDTTANFVGRMATTSGWGKIGDVPGFINTDLLYVNVLIVDNAECVAAYGPHNVPNTKMCISTNGGLDGPCHGDSGGPMYLPYFGEQILVGTVSFGAKQGCQSGFPDVYTRVTSYLDWIAAHGGPAVRE